MTKKRKKALEMRRKRSLQERGNPQWSDRKNVVPGDFDDNQWPHWGVVELIKGKNR